MNKKTDVYNIVSLGILSALAFVLQFFVKIPLGAHSISVSLTVILLAAVLHGYVGGAVVGGASAVAILLNGDAALFYYFSYFLTILVVLIKGIASGVAAAAIFKLLKKVNEYLAIVVAAIVAPIVNTGIFYLGSVTLFYGNIQEMSGGTNVFLYVILVFIGLNFVFELVANVILSPAILRLIKIIPKIQNRF